MAKDGRERSLHPTGAQRNVTNDCRAVWVADGGAAHRHVVDAARLGGVDPFATKLEIISAELAAIIGAANDGDAMPPHCDRSSWQRKNDDIGNFYRN